MKKRIQLLFFLLPFFASAQVIVEPGVGFMFLQQRGFVFIDPCTPGYSSSAFPYRLDIGRYLSPFGGTFAVWVPFKMVTSYTQRYKFGVQTGMGYYSTWKKKSIDPNYYPPPEGGFLAKTFGILHLPMLVSLRTGSALFPESGVFGFAIAAGVDAFYLNIPDEKGFALIPTTNFTFMKGKNGVRAGFYHLKFKSVFKSNAGEVVRLKTSFFQLEVFHSF